MTTSDAIERLLAISVEQHTLLSHVLKQQQADIVALKTEVQLLQRQANRMAVSNNSNGTESPTSSSSPSIVIRGMGGLRTKRAGDDELVIELSGAEPASSVAAQTPSSPSAAEPSSMPVRDAQLGSTSPAAAHAAAPVALAIDFSDSDSKPFKKVRQFQSNKPKPQILPRSLQRGGAAVAAPAKAAAATTSVAATATTAAAAPASTRATSAPLPSNGTMSPATFANASGPSAPPSHGDRASTLKDVSDGAILRSVARLTVGVEMERSNPDVVVSCVVISSDACCLVAGTSDGKLHMWVRPEPHASHGWRHVANVVTVEGAAPLVNALAMWGSLLLAGGSDGAVRAWRCRALAADHMQPGGELYVLRTFGARCAIDARGMQMGVQSIALPPVRFFSDETSREELLKNAAASCEERLLPSCWAVTGGQDGALCVWDVDTGELVQRELLGGSTTKKGKPKKGHVAPWVMSVAIAHGGLGKASPLVLSACASGEVLLWTATSIISGGAVAMSPLVITRRLQAALPSMLAVGGTPKPPPMLLVAALSADGTRAAIGLSDGVLRVWDAKEEVDKPAEMPPVAIELLSESASGAADSGERCSAEVSSMAWRETAVADVGESSSSQQTPSGAELFVTTGDKCTSWRFEPMGPSERRPSRSASRPPDCGDVYDMVVGDGAGGAAFAEDAELFLAAGGHVHCLAW